MRKTLEEMDIIVLGEYGTYAFTEKKRPLCWEVIKENENEVLLNATELLEKRPFNTTGEDNEFASSELNQWLNNTFLNTAFSKSQQQAMIKKTHHHLYEIYAGQVGKSQDIITIPSIANASLIYKRKSLRNELIEGKYKGAWLRDGLKINRVAYEDSKQANTTYGLMPSEALEIHPYLYVNGENFSDFEFIDATDDYMNGIVSFASDDKCIFYVNGKYVTVHFDKTNQWGYIKNIKDEAIIIYHKEANNTKDNKLIFPNTLDHHKVIGILGKYPSLDIKQIIIEEGIEFVGDEVLVCYPNLLEINLPNSMKSFSASNLVACPKIEKIKLAKDHPYFVVEDDVLYNKNKTTLIKYISSRPNASYQCPNTITKIEPGAFCDAPHLSELTIPEIMHEIQDYTFAFADIDKVILHNQVTSIGRHAFENAKINSIILPDTLKTIEDEAFMNCHLLQEIILPKTIKSIGKKVFMDCHLLTSVRIPEGISALDGTFKNCLLLTQVYIPDSVKTITPSTFDINPYEANQSLTIYAQPNSFIETYVKEYGLSFSTKAFNDKTTPRKEIVCSEKNDYLKAQVGDILTLGTYIQSATTKHKEPIEWYVIKKENNQLMLLSKYALFDKEYDLEMNRSYNVKNNQAVEWNCSELMKYLNTIFMDETFDSLEKEWIVSKKISSFENSASYQSDLSSHVFLLSSREVDELLNDEMRIAYRTEYQYVQNGLFRKAQWWLRSIDEEEQIYSGVWYMDIILPDGSLSATSSNVKLSVRPALWIDLNKIKNQ